MLRCVNCLIKFFLKSYDDGKVFNLDPEHVQVLQEWLADFKLTEEHFICLGCQNLIAREVKNRKYGQPPGDRVRAHASVCLRCGKSCLRKRCSFVKEDHIWNILVKQQSNLPVPESRRVCRACHYRVKVHYDTVHGNNTPKDLVEFVPVPPNTDQENNTSAENVPSSNITENTTSDKFMLTQYSHTEDISDRCFVPECQNPERLPVPQFTRKKILFCNKIYVTPNARVCEEHKNLYIYHLLNDFKFSREFEPQHIKEMLELFNSKCSSKNPLGK